jgi:hypothetical protein
VALDRETWSSLSFSHFLFIRFLDVSIFSFHIHLLDLEHIDLLMTLLILFKYELNMLCSAQLLDELQQKWMYMLLE